MADNTKLTPKQQAFCEYYLQSFNATEAAIKAGYSKKTARFIGAENLTKPYIKNYIEKVNKMATNKRILTLEQIKEMYTDIAMDKDVESRDRLSALEKLSKYVGVTEAEERKYQLEREKLELEKVKHRDLLNMETSTAEKVGNTLMDIMEQIKDEVNK